MKTFIEEYRRMQNISITSEYERQRHVLKEALEKIANLATGEPAKIAREALDSIYPIKGATK